jgi:hypothetical protein
MQVKISQAKECVSIIFFHDFIVIVYRMYFICLLVGICNMG